MTKKGKFARDPFTFSLGGMTTIASFVFVPAIADDRINTIRDRRLEQARKGRERKPRSWIRGHGRDAQGDCA